MYSGLRCRELHILEWGEEVYEAGMIVVSEENERGHRKDWE